MRTRELRIQVVPAGYDAAVPIPTLLAETDVLYSAGVAHVLEGQPDFSLRLPALRDQASLEAALGTETNAIAIVSDTLLKDLAHLARVSAENGCKLILLTTRPPATGLTGMPAIRGALRRNADGQQLMACLRVVASGAPWCTPAADAARNTTGARILAQLSARQIKVMSGVSRGAKNVAIARELGTSEQVVKNMLGGIYDLAGVSDRLELALFVLHHPELAEAARFAAREFPTSHDNSDGIS